MKLGKVTGTSEANTTKILASGKIRMNVMMELCKHVKDGRILDEWKTSEVVPIYKGKGDVVSCRSYKGIKLLEHAKKIVERVLPRYNKSR